MFSWQINCGYSVIMDQSDAVILLSLCHWDPVLKYRGSNPTLGRCIRWSGSWWVQMCWFYFNLDFFNNQLPLKGYCSVGLLVFYSCCHHHFPGFTFLFTVVLQLFPLVLSPVCYFSLCCNWRICNAIKTDKNDKPTIRAPLSQLVPLKEVTCG